MSGILFQNVCIVDPQSAWNGQQVDVLVEAGKISKIAAAHSLRHENTVSGGCLSPGWVDLRCQLMDPGFELKEDLASLNKAALAGGFSTVVTMPNSFPVQDNAGQIAALIARSQTLGIQLLPMGALSVGAQGKDLAELYDLQQSGAVAFTDGRKGSQSASLLLRALQYVQPFKGLVVQSPVDQSLSEGESVAEGISSVRMGMKGIPAMAEALMIGRDLRLLEQTGGNLHIGPLTTVDGLQLIREAKARGLQVTAETSALYLLLDATENEAFDAVTKVFPPLQAKADVLALRAAVLDGTIDVISSSHHPQGREEKSHDFADASFGADTLETAFSAILTAFQDTSDALEVVVTALTAHPRRILGLPALVIQEGHVAELTHFDPVQAWQPALSDIRSKCKYNPLIGRELKGKVLGVYAKAQHFPNT